MAAVALVPVSATTALCAQSADRVQLYLDSARARNTIRGYRSSFHQFEQWCETVGLCPMPAGPETIACYLGAQAGRLRAATLAHHLAAIAKAHKSAGFPSPIKDNQLIAETLKGIKRTHGTAAKQKAPVLTEDLRMMLRLLPNNVLGIRDRALLLVGFAGAFRRSELVSLDVADLQFTAEGLLITLRRSKTDQDGEGRQIAIPHGKHAETCAVRAVHAWLDAATSSPQLRDLAFSIRVVFWLRAYWSSRMVPTCIAASRSVPSGASSRSDEPRRGFEAHAVWGNRK